MEKKNEYNFQTYINTIPNNYKIIYNPNEEELLKKMFENCSKQKNGKGRGIPDRILINSNNIIIVEIKPKLLKSAISDLKIYRNKLNRNITELQTYNIYYLAFVNSCNYEIYNDNDFRKEIKTIYELLTTNNSQLINVKLSNDFLIKQNINNIHNYIYENTKMSNEDKPFFIAIILLSLQKESFIQIIKNYNTKKYVYDLLIENLKDYNIDISVFNFLRNDTNNIHFLNIINMLIEIFEKNKDNIDLLNEFYTEFVKYSNTDSKSLGIVLTPAHIVSLMIRLLNINKNDIVLDLCTGTGSFLCEALKYNPKKIIGCEYQTKLFSLLKCNIILRNFQNYEIIKGDCFDEIKNVVATKSIINPPYNKCNELKFIIKQIDSICENGYLTALVPITNLTKQSKNRDYIYNNARIDTIIKCNHNLFYPNAGVLCCIILLEKTKYGHKDKSIVKLIDYTEDGYEIKHGYGRIKNKQCDININNCKNVNCYISKESNWIESLNLLIEKDNITSKDLKLTLLEINYNTDILNILNTSLFNNDINIEYDFLKVIDIFDILNKPIEKYNKPTKYVNLISAKNNDNGIKSRILSNEETFIGNKIVLVVSGNGGAGLAHYQQDDFNISSATIVLSPKENFNMDKYIGIYCARELSNNKKIYSRGYTWTNSRIEDTIIKIPKNINMIQNMFE
jgi:type I restriction enzyme M protein